VMEAGAAAAVVKALGENGRTGGGGIAAVAAAKSRKRTGSRRLLVNIRKSPRSGAVQAGAGTETGTRTGSIAADDRHDLDGDSPPDCVCRLVEVSEAWNTCLWS